MQKLYWLLALVSIAVFKHTPKAIAQTTVNLSELSDIKLDDYEADETADDLIKRLKQSKAEKIINLRNSLLKEENKTEKPLNSPNTSINIASANFSTFPVGLNIGKRNVKAGVLVRGNEDGAEAVDFQNWLLPYDAVISALNLNVTTLPDGQLEVRSPGIVTRINPEQLRNDSELGLVFSIADLQRLFGISAKFDIDDYAIVFDVPWLNKTNNRIGQAEIPVILDGLPRFQPGNFNIAAVEQRIDASGSGNGSTNFRGDFQAVGTAFDGSWFVRANQPDLWDGGSWKISEAQYLRQTDKTDYFVGSQPSFWQRLGTGGEYWGLTFIQRQGFNPPQTFGGGTSDPRQRLQADQIGRTVTGRAEPGTLVRLVQGFGNNVIAEVLVDSSGIYRFENITTQRGYANYRVFLYPQGRLTAQPEIREAAFTTVPGQIPAGASAWVVSGGLQRDFSGNDSLLGNFSEFRGGIARRLGVSETLTLGFGGVYDESLRGLAELFYRPKNIPLQVAVSALAGDGIDVISDIRFQPSNNLIASFTSDRLSNRFNVNWRVSSGLSLFANTSSRNATEGGLQFNFSGKNFYTFARASLDTDSNLRWNLLQRLGKLGLNLQGNEIGTSSELAYNFSNARYSNTGSSLLLNYDTRSNNNISDNLLTLGWRYRSPQRAFDGNYVWQAELGYGMGSQGNGIVATLGTTVLPGIMLQGRYQGVSLTRNDSSFSINLVSGLNLQQGIRPGDRRSKYFRTQGGLTIKPFLDSNNNGKRDSGEKIYTENSDLLLMVNNKSIKSWRSHVQNDRITVRLPPGSYRLDLDPAGFPLDWHTSTNALAVDVVAGSYTPIMIPLTRSYTRTGVVTDSTGEAVAGTRVEAIGKDIRKFSVTNGAGVYYLEGLQEGEYELQINGKSAGELKLQESDEAFGELNLKY
ncbi:carboxypeptidase-like regulatory domain-containing protein [Calothrix sp. CCY 0018]|uniref:carboxypeptidase-like regulatory domain-containing protein n=1 Tax=Calothrix sp. CCY 0018 TaxID=3103864 RepID=UPI0039C60986